MKYEVKLSNLNKGIFKAYIKAKENNDKKIDTTFINNVCNLKKNEVRKLIFELNDLDYEKEYVPKSASIYRLVQMLIDKYQRLYEVLNKEIKK